MKKRILAIDLQVLDSVAKLHKPFTNKVMKIITYLGNLGTVWFVLCVPFILSKKFRLTGFMMLLALVIAYLMGEVIIKHLVGRQRPCHSFSEEEQIINKPKFYSFPSGHTTSSFSIVAVTMMRCEPYIWIPVLCLAVLIGFSRIYLRVHYLTDVIVGMALGLLCGCASVGIINHFFAV